MSEEEQDIKEKGENEIDTDFEDEFDDEFGRDNI